MVGVLEPSVPYPVATEMIANIVTSPHHLSATMVTGREHRMTEVFARLAPAPTSKRPAPNCGLSIRRWRPPILRCTSPPIITRSEYPHA